MPMAWARLGHGMEPSPHARHGRPRAPAGTLTLKLSPPEMHGRADVLVLPQLPLVVGAAHSAGLPRADLCLPASRCAGLDATHFCVLALGRIPAVMDTHSDTGTCVNGHWIGHRHGRSHALLRAGWNELVVGQGTAQGRLWLGWHESGA